MEQAKTDGVSKALSTSVEQKTMFDLVNSSVKELAKALPKHLSPERLARIATTCIRQNPKLAACTPSSFMGALFTAAQLGLEPVAGLAHLIPFNNNRKVNGEWRKVMEVQFVIGYKGITDLFYRHEKSGLVDWGTVHEKDEFSYEYGTNAHLKHIPAVGERGKVIGFYVIFKLSTGFTKFQYMTQKECMDHGMKHSKTYDSDARSFDKKSPWATNPDAMCLKTVLIQAAKTVPLAIELRKALEVDETSRDFKDGMTDAMDVTSTTEWNPEPTKEIPQADTSKVVGALGHNPPPPAEKAPETPPAGQESAPPQPQGLAEGQFILAGLIASMEDAKSEKSPTKFYLQGEWCQTWDKKVIALLTGYYVEETEVSVTCHKETKGRWTNNLIDAVAAPTTKESAQ